MWRSFVLLISVGFVSHVAGAAFEAKLTRVISGDTVEVTDPKGHVTRYRLVGANAPNKKETGYSASIKALKRLCEGRKVLVEPMSAKFCVRGSDCILLARVLYRRDDIALRQILNGHAIHDTRQLREQSTTDRTLYKDAMSLAKNKRRGLWAKSAKP